MAWEVMASPKRAGRNSGSKENSIVIGLEKSCGKKDGMSVSFRIGVEVAKSLRWQKGDRVVIVRDGDTIGLRRTAGKSSEGWVLSQSGSGNALRFKIVNDAMAKSLTMGEVIDPLIAGDVVVIGEANNKVNA